MKITRFYFNMLPVNCYVLWNDNSRECAIVDAGCYYTKEEETLARFISDNQLTVTTALAMRLWLKNTESRSVPHRPTSFCYNSCHNNARRLVFLSRERLNP